VFPLLAQTQPIANATADLAKTGLLGSLLAVALSAIVYLWFDSRAAQKRKEDDIAALNASFVKKLEELQGLRIQDQKGVTEQLLRLTEQCTTAVNGATNAMVATREAMGELRESLKDLGDEIRRSLPIRRS
jgi:hypothetical protein